MAEDPSKEWFETFQKMWNPASFPLPGVFVPTIDPAEVEKKITELRAVENWLKVNMGFLQMTIKTLEMQKSAIETLKEAGSKSPDKP
jgi:hypothetical protein